MIQQIFDRFIDQKNILGLFIYNLAQNSLHN